MHSAHTNDCYPTLVTLLTSFRWVPKRGGFSLLSVSRLNRFDLPPTSHNKNSPITNNTETLLSLTYCKKRGRELFCHFCCHQLLHFPWDGGRSKINLSWSKVVNFSLLLLLLLQNLLSAGKTEHKKRKKWRKGGRRSLLLLLCHGTKNGLLFPKWIVVKEKENKELKNLAQREFTHYHIFISL